jgi:cyclophilin family peptidyl-prolyl cis-trans isomerase
MCIDAVYVCAWWSEFFLTYDKASHLNNVNTIFGRSVASESEIQSDREACR